MKSPIHEKTLRFAIRMVHLNRYLIQKKQEYIISKQIMRAGTNPGAMVREAQNSESDRDFIHKLAIAQKEIGETQYWLELLAQTGYLSQTEYCSLLSDSQEIMKMLRSAILTKKQKINRQNHS